MKISCVYLIRNIINNKIYIGCTSDLSSRKSNHLHHLNAGKHANTPLQQDYSRVGEPYFSFEILAKCPKQYLNKLEWWFINKLNPEYNLSKTERSPVRQKRSEQVRLNMRNSHLGIPCPHLEGRKLSQLTKDRISATKKAQPHWRTVLKNKNNE